MIHCSLVEGFSSPPKSGLLNLGVEGSVIFKKLDLKLHLTPMVFCACEKFWDLGSKKNKIRRKWEKWVEGGSSFPFILWTIAIFTLKRVVQKWGTFSKIIGTCQQGEEPKSLTKSISKSKKKTAFAKMMKQRDPLSTGSILHFTLFFS